VIAAPAEHTVRPLHVRHAAAVATAVGVLVAIHVTIHQHAHPAWNSDLDQVWAGARALWANQNPYEAVGPAGTRFRWQWPLFYPIWALLAASPFVWLSLHVFQTVTIGASAAWMTYALARTDRWALLTLLSGPFISAVGVGTWEPVLVAAALTPGAATFLLAKPNAGMALAASLSPSRSTAISLAAAALVVVVTVVVWPWWPGAWLSALRQQAHFAAPVMLPFGFLALLAAVRWRRAEARLLTILACVPQTTFPQCALPLFLVPATRAERLALSLMSLAPLAVEYWPHQGTFGVQAHRIGVALVLAVYLPATVMVLRRRNEWTALGAPASPWRSCP
jgi:hypothetical protein